jgi:hypothetical protein
VTLSVRLLHFSLIATSKHDQGEEKGKDLFPFGGRPSAKLSIGGRRFTGAEQPTP